MRAKLQAKGRLLQDGVGRRSGAENQHIFIVGYGVSAAKPPIITILM